MNVLTATATAMAPVAVTPVTVMATAPAPAPAPVTASARETVTATARVTAADTVPAAPPALKSRHSPLLAAAGRKGRPDRPATRWGRGFPGPAPATPASPHSTPVPTRAHPNSRAIRVLRSPR